MNAGLTLLILFAILLTIIVLVLIVWGYYSMVKSQTDANNGNGNGTTPGVLPYCSDIYENSDLIQIPIDAEVCTQQNKLTSMYYVGDIAPYQYNYVVAPYPSNALDVCVGFCQVYKDGNCTGDPYNGKSAQDNFDTCMEQLSSTECIPPKPIATKDNKIYYAFSPTCSICDNCV